MSRLLAKGTFEVIASPVWTSEGVSFDGTINSCHEGGREVIGLTHMEVSTVMELSLDDFGKGAYRLAVKDVTVPEDLRATSIIPRPAKDKSVENHDEKKVSPFIAIVESDRIFLYSPAPARALSRPGAEDEACPTQPFADDAAFRLAFHYVWMHLPDEASSLLVAYWRSPAAHKATEAQERGFTPWPEPHIQIVDDRMLTSVDARSMNMGHTLLFRASVTRSSPEHLRFVIARELAAVSLYADKTHWRLACQLVLDPLDEWANKLSRRPSDKQRERKQSVLDVQFLREHDIELRRILSEWGFAAPARG